MTKANEIRCFDYVNHPFEQVDKLLRADPLPVFSRATQRASARADTVASQLHVNVGAIEVATEIDIVVTRVEDLPRVGTKVAAGTRIVFEWKAKRAPGLFPLMKAELDVYPLTNTETQLDFHGQYEVPLGILGKGLDAVVGNRIAEASIHQFVTEVAQYLRTTIR